MTANKSLSLVVRSCCECLSNAIVIIILFAQKAESLCLRYTLDNYLGFNTCDLCMGPFTMFNIYLFVQSVIILNSCSVIVYSEALHDATVVVFATNIEKLVRGPCPLLFNTWSLPPPL